MMWNLENIRLEHTRVLRFKIEQQFLDMPWSALREFGPLLSVRIASKNNFNAVDLKHNYD